MPLQVPAIDDRTFEQLLEEAKRRIPVHTPEWTNFEVESDPGITIVQLFAFLTESLLYRANRMPERNRLKFLQLLGIPLQPAAAAEGIIVVRPDRSPVEALPLDAGIVVNAASVRFLTRQPLTVLPVDAQVYFKRPIERTDARYADFRARYEAVIAALAVEQAGTASAAAATVGDINLDFYETASMTPPTPSDPRPVLDLGRDTLDGAVYLALLAPPRVSPQLVREKIAERTLSIGIAPALADNIAPLRAMRAGSREPESGRFVFEAFDAQGSGSVARYTRLSVAASDPVMDQVGVVHIELPTADRLQPPAFAEPLQEGIGAFPPQIEDEQIGARLVAWIRIRLDAPRGARLGPVSSARGIAAQIAELRGSVASARLTWVGVNAVRIQQAVPIVNEPLGNGTGEPDQTVRLSSAPVLAPSVRLEIQDDTRAWRAWRLTDDLLAAQAQDEVFTLDPESGEIRFGDGLRGKRPPRDARRRVSYEYGGGREGNVAHGAVKATSDVRLQGAFRIENPIPTWGGDTSESVEEAERNIPLFLRHRDRLVTRRDFEDLTKRTPGADVGRVEVLPLLHPDRPGVTAPGVVTVLVVPQFDRARPYWPSPDRLFLRRVAEHLEPRRLLTTEVHLRGPRYVPVYVTVGVRVRGGHARDLVIGDVNRRLREYLSALPPGGPDATGWPLFKRLLKKDLEAVVTRVGGVEYVQSIQLGADRTFDIEQRDFGPLELPLLSGVDAREGEALDVAAVVPAAGPIAPTEDDAASFNSVPVPVTRTKC
jgi:hypothetical protein